MMVKTVTLPIPPIAAFELFTQKAGEGWPKDRRHSGDRDSEIFMLQSGRFYERARNGHEVELGHVQAWDQPNRILLDFFVATSPERPTEVEVTFAAQEGGTHVTVIHRPKPSSVDLWSERAPLYAQSWDLALAAMSRAAA
jgi:hypothetical protein